MKIMVWVGHPKHVHFWRHIVNNLSNHGHDVKILAVEKDIAPDGSEITENPYKEKA